jgi:hypothetical protein
MSSYSNITDQSTNDLIFGPDGTERGGVLRRIVVNEFTANGVVTVTDGAGGTAVATITSPGALLQSHGTFEYNLTLQTGLRVVTSGADQDITVVWD